MPIWLARILGKDWAGFSVFDDRVRVHFLAVRKALQLTLTVRVILEALLDRNTQHHCHFERSLEGGRILILLHRNDRLACDADPIGEFLLRHLPPGPKFSNLIAYSGHQSAFR